MTSGTSSTGRLLDMKEWLTISDAAFQIGKTLNEPVSAADVLSLALDGRIRLSVRFSDYVPVKHKGTITYKKELFDLVMDGDGRAEVERMHHSLVGGKDPDCVFFFGEVFVEDQEGTQFQVQVFDPPESQKKYEVSRPFPPEYYSPATNLPNCAILVLRTTELTKLNADVEDQKFGAGVTSSNDYVQPQEEPLMKCGTNSRKSCEAWCAFMAYKVEGVTRDALAKKIKEEADRRNYLMQKGDKFSIHMIVGAIPKSTTGTLQDNRNGGKLQKTV